MISISLLNFCFYLLSFHPFHVSVCDVVYDPEAKAIQISQRIFVDDLETALRKKYNVKLVIDDQSLKAERDSLIELYLSENLKLFIDGKERDRDYIGSEFEEDGIWCYIEYTGVKKMKVVEVRSTVLLESFEDQANIIYFKTDNYDKSRKLDNTITSTTFPLPDK